MSVIKLSTLISNYQGFIRLLWRQMDRCNKAHGFGLVYNDPACRDVHRKIIHIIRTRYSHFSMTDVIDLTEDFIAEVLQEILDEIDGVFEADRYPPPSPKKLDVSPLAKRIVFVEIIEAFYKHCFGVDIIDVSPLRKKKAALLLYGGDIESARDVPHSLGIDVDVFRQKRPS